MKCVRVTLKDTWGETEGSYYSEIKEVGDLFDEWDEPGMTYTLELVEMSQEEFDALPEFRGF